LIQAEFVGWRRLCAAGISDSGFFFTLLSTSRKDC